jgi:hypothetical protein
MSLPFLCFSGLRGLEHPPACSPFLIVQGGCPRMCYSPSGLTGWCIQTAKCSLPLATAGRGPRAWGSCVRSLACGRGSMILELINCDRHVHSRAESS